MDCRMVSRGGAGPGYASPVVSTREVTSSTSEDPGHEVTGESALMVARTPTAPGREKVARRGFLDSPMGSSRRSAPGESDRVRRKVARQWPATPTHAQGRARPSAPARVT